MAEGKKELVLVNNEYAWVKDLSGGMIYVYLGPHKEPLSVDSEIVIQNENREFVSIGGGLLKGQTFVQALESQYVILHNPEVAGQRAMTKGKNDANQLQTGKSIIKRGPCEFPLWPGQQAKVVDGHRLTSNQFLRIRVEGEIAPADIKPLQDGGLQKQMLPAWVLMMVLLVSFIIIPAQVAEEKEKNLLIGLLQTPMRETEWLIAKLVTGLILINIAVVVLQLPVGFYPLESPGYIFFLEMGSFCFVSSGIMLGFLCRTQASARTLGVLLYIPLLIPSALSDFSVKLNKIASIVPSYQLYNPLKSILLENSGLSYYPRQWIFLFLLGALAFLFSHTLMKRRWLM